MNKPNNKRKRDSINRIETAFIELLQTKELNEINVTELVKKAEVNRSTFYVNYIDIYDLADQMKENMFKNLINLYQDESLKKEHSYNYLKLFYHIKDHQQYYKILFKLNFDFMNYYDFYFEEDEAIKYLGTTKHIDYHIEFFKAGISAIIKKWLSNNCQESPEQINQIIVSEYANRGIN